jgi:pyruvate ferredoxin oxidoreductase alpha subunit
MLKQIEGSRARAEAIALCRPQVICAYPITPQTHIVEGLGEMVKAQDLKGCEFINVESEFAALSVAIGASATGARAYTATSSQGLLFMIEAVYNASGLGLPIVMTLGNRAIGAPINIWNDHSDAMAVKDAGWIMLFAETNQEAVDLHIQAFRLAEELSCPVMVNVDGFILTHAYERVDLPTQEQVDAFLPPYEPRQVLDPAEPVSIGAMVGPEAFTEVRYLAHYKQLQALSLIPELAAAFEAQFGRDAGGLIHTYRAADAETIVVAMGSVNGTIKDVVDEMRAEGHAIGSVVITSFRPFPLTQVHDALFHAKRVVVVEKSLAVGLGGNLASNVRMALRTSGRDVRVLTAIAGLGGRPITAASLRNLLEQAEHGKLEDVTFLDLNWEVVNREVERMKSTRRSGPIAENILRTLSGTGYHTQRVPGDSVPPAEGVPVSSPV